MDVLCDDRTKGNGFGGSVVSLGLALYFRPELDPVVFIRWPGALSE
jgi:hypothetical protein